MQMTIQDLVQGARSRLIQAGISADAATLDAELLAREVLGWDKARFISERNESATTGFLLNYEHFVARRMRREPIHYIIGTREFWSLDFEVTPDVLIPRPETELIVEEALERLRQATHDFLIYDIGTGSGVLAVVLARAFPHARVIATDLSSRAIAVARRNAERHGVANRVRFVETSFLEGLEEKASLIVSNPPYVPAVFAPGLTPEVRDYEPGIAVFGGDDGLEGIRQVIDAATTRLLPGAWLIFEFGYGQEADVRTLIEGSGQLQLEKIRGDLQDIPRTAVTRKPAGATDR